MGILVCKSNNMQIQPNPLISSPWMDYSHFISSGDDDPAGACDHNGTTTITLSQLTYSDISLFSQGPYNDIMGRLLIGSMNFAFEL
jgi:hypothetical protein